MSGEFPATVFGAAELVVEDTDPFATYSPRTRGAFRIGLAVDAVVGLTVALDGGTPIVLNAEGKSSGVQVANGGYTYAYPGRPGIEYQFALSGAATIIDVQIDFVKGGVI